MNGCMNAMTGVSPFFLSHGFELSPFEPKELTEDIPTTIHSSIQKGENIIQIIHDGLEWAKASMTYTQQEAEHHTNQKRDSAPEYHAGDKVWLFLQNVHMMRPCWKLDWKHTKYTIQETIGTHVI